jgi:sulfur-carrier protein adenylyltransferase/sulfurtransferase
MLFDPQEWQRYSRHIQLPQLGALGQTKLKQSHVLVVGAGGLGAPALLYLAAAGVGTISIVDGDSIEISNLQRQVLFQQQHLGQNKALIAKQQLHKLNPSIKIHAVAEHLTFNNAESLISTVDLVLDCTDNFAARYLLNDACLKKRKPWIFASIDQFSGQCALFTNQTLSDQLEQSDQLKHIALHRPACFRCLFPQAPSNSQDCNSAGVIGVLPGMLSLFQTNEALKYLTGLETPLANTLLIIDAINLDFKKIQLQNNTECPACLAADKPLSKLDDYLASCHNEPLEAFEILAEQIEQKMSQSSLLIDVRSNHERAAFHRGGIHIPLEQMEKTIKQLPAAEEFIVYCQSGSRSRQAVQLLLQHNRNAKSIKGGLTAWLKLNVEH